jgi:hypothetical protein
MRATVSPALPAVNGLITLTTRVGHVSALAAAAAASRIVVVKMPQSAYRGTRIDRI